MEGNLVSKEGTELFQINVEIFRSPHPVLNLFMVSILLPVQRNHLHLISLSLHHFHITHESIIINIIILKHPRKLKELLEIAVIHLPRERTIEQSVHHISGLIVIRCFFLHGGGLFFNFAGQ